MADDILDFLGLKSDPKEHPADSEVLSFLGLKPIKDEHPAYADPYNLGSPEERAKTPAAPPRSTLRDIHEAIDPSRVVPAVLSDVGHNIADSASASANMAIRGAGETVGNQPASGVGDAILGTAGVALSPLTGAVQSGRNALSSVTGNPDFADKAALMVPLPVGKATSAVKTAVAPSTRAADLVAETVGDKMPEVLARMRSNPRLRPIDTNDQLRMAGQGLIASPKSPDASRALTENMRASAAGARDAVKGTYNETMGAPPNVYDEYMRLQNQAQTIGKTKIQPTLDAAKPIDTTSVIADMDKAIKPGAQAVVPGEPKFQSKLQTELQEWKHELTDGQSVLTDPDKLHIVQSEMRRRAEELSMNPETRRLGRQLYEYRNKLVDSIDASAPGYKEGLKAYRDQKDIEEAYKFGRDVLKNGEDFKTDPSYLAQWVKHKDRTPEELAAARLGARQAVEAKMGSIKQSALDPARSGIDVPQVEFNRAKLEHLFGKENTDKMFQHLQDERDIALTNNRGLGNSKTAETQSWQQRLEPRDIQRPHGQLPLWASMVGGATGALSHSPELGVAAGVGLLGARGAKSGYDWLARRGEVSRNNSIADLITRNDSETIALLSAAADRAHRRNKLGNLLAPP